jgi:membrane peptidoglycan carboxypeptidase
VLLAGAIALVLVGALIGGGGLYASVAPVTLADLPGQSTLYYRDGTVLGRVGGLNRHPVAYGELVDGVPAAAVAAEDREFWTANGGAISRSVVRMSLGFEPRGRRERAEVAIQAWKLNDRYPKEQILEYFLNGVPFGRQTYGVEAAAETYFGKSGRSAAPPERS